MAVLPSLSIHPPSASKIILYPRSTIGLGDIRSSMRSLSCKTKAGIEGVMGAQEVNLISLLLLNITKVDFIYLVTFRRRS